MPGEYTVEYMCTERKVERKKLTDVFAKEEQRLVKVFTARAINKIRKCAKAIDNANATVNNNKDKKKKGNRELIAKKGDSVSFIEWRGWVVIKSDAINKGIAFVRDWEEIRPHLDKITENFLYLDVYGGKTDSKDVTGVSFGSRLDRGSAFVLWFLSENILNEINGVAAGYDPQPQPQVPIQMPFPGQLDQALPQPQPYPQQLQPQPQIVYFEIPPHALLPPPTLSPPPQYPQYPQEQNNCAFYAQDEFNNEFKSFEDPQCMYPGDAQERVLSNEGYGDEVDQDFTGNISEVPFQFF